MKLTVTFGTDMIFVLSKSSPTMRCFLILFIVMILTACGGNESYEDLGEYSEKEVVIEEGDILINEFAPKGKARNEYDKKSDWVELYNTTNNDLTLIAGKWYLTDDPKEPQKFEIPEVSIASKDFLIIWCDGKDTLHRDIHANFKLSGKGENICLFQDGEMMDQIAYPKWDKFYKSSGRSTDGGEEWINFEVATPGASNQ